MSCTVDARRFAERHLAACAADVLTWRKTGRLPEPSPLRELGAIYGDAGFDDALQQAEAIVTQVALVRVSSAT